MGSHCLPWLCGRDLMVMLRTWSHNQDRRVGLFNSRPFPKQESPNTDDWGKTTIISGRKEYPRTWPEHSLLHILWVKQKGNKTTSSWQERLAKLARCSVDSLVYTCLLLDILPKENLLRNGASGLYIPDFFNSLYFYALNMFYKVHVHEKGIPGHL